MVLIYNAGERKKKQKPGNKIAGFLINNIIIGLIEYSK